MQKVLTIAKREYFAMVATKAFLFTIAMMPVLMFGGIMLGSMLSSISDVADKRIVVLDSTGKLFERLNQQVALRNDSIDKSRTQPGTAEKKDDVPFVSAEAKYFIEQKQVDEVTDEIRVNLSNRIRVGEIFAFLEIPAGVFDIAENGAGPQVRFYSQDSVISPTRRWFEQTLNEIVKTKRLEEVGIDRGLVEKASRHVEVAGLGLFERDDSGQVARPEEKDNMASVFLPFGIMMLMFMVIFLAAQPMLESVVEEKTDGVAEVLLGSANPFQLMLGKLLGNVAGSLCIFGAYFTGGYFLAVYKGWADLIPFEIAPWFIAYQIVAVMFYSSIFMAVGASVSQLKEAQSMLLPVWMLLAFPMFIWFQAMSEPNGTLATWTSFIPPATPLMMVLRLSTDTPIPLWQPIVGLILLLMWTLLCVFFAGRIFRIGMLWQGKTPQVSELIRWAAKG